jgi:asparagine synthase (glutamine-hydrolysing)
MRPAVIEVAEGIPFAALTRYDVGRLYSLKGEIVSRGIRHLTGISMPVFPKRRFQHGALPAGQAPRRFPFRETDYRSHFHSLYA